MFFRKPQSKAEAAQKLRKVLSNLEDVRIYMEESEMMEDLDKVLITIEEIDDILTEVRWAIEAYKEWN
jgi:hypothetical protein